MVQLELIAFPLAPDHAAYRSPEGEQLLQGTADFYHEVGFTPPWAGYFVLRDGAVVGTGAFTGPPRDGEVEIAYWTFPAYEGQGIASATCQALLAIAQAADPTVRITAKTAPEHNASTRILEKNGFVYSGVVQDHEIGDAWRWVRS